MIKKIQKNGYVCIPKKLRERIASDKVEFELMEMDGQNVIVIKPVGQTKQPVTIYK